MHESQIPCPPSHPLDHHPQASVREKAPIEHRPKRLVSRPVPQISQCLPRPQQAGTTCRAARGWGGGICPMRGREFRKQTKNLRIRTINCASTSNPSDTTRFRDAGVAWRAHAAPCRTRRIKPVMSRPRARGSLAASRMLCSFL